MDAIARDPLARDRLLGARVVLRGVLRLVIAFALGAALVVAAGLGATRASRVDRLYSDDSPFNQTIAEGAPVDPKSAHMIGSLVRAGRKQGFLIALKRWTTPVYYADDTTPRYRVKMTAKWAPANWFEGVPIPDGAMPDPAGDGHMVIIDKDSGCEFDFWRAKKVGASWEASWGNSLRTDGDGVFPKGLSARGSGFAVPAGMIFPDELIAGRIDHALEFSYNYPKRGGPVHPATESDGHSGRSDAIPEGARLRLDPDLDLDALGLTRYERIIAEAAQRYGMILADNGGGVELQAVHPMSYDDDVYAGVLPDRRYVYLNNIPLDRFEVLKLPPQTDPDNDIVPSGCGTLTRRP